MNLYLNEDHDIVVGKRIARVSGAQQVAQLIKCRLSAFLGEWPIDPSVGLPWDIVLRRGYDVDTIYHAVRRKLETTKGVKQIKSFNMTPGPRRERKLHIQFEVVTEFGVLSEIIRV